MLQHKRTLAGILAATMMFSLTACGGGGATTDSGSDAAQDPNEAAAAGTLQLSEWEESSGIFNTDETDEELYEKAKEEGKVTIYSISSRITKVANAFMEKYPGIDVTHDQVEALTMSTKIAIFREGIIIQVAHPLELYNNPANLYVADFIGNPRINFVDGKAEVSASGLTVNSVLGRMTFPVDHLKDENMPQEASFDAVLGIRPEQIAINTSRQSPSDIEAHIYTSMPAGSETLVTVKVGGVSMVIKALGITHYNPDQVVYLSIDTTKINVFDKKTENLIKYSVE